MSESGSVDHVLRLLEAAVQVSGAPRRRLEERLGMGRGQLAHLFDGRIPLELRHLEIILSEIGLSPGVFFQMAYPPPVAALAPPGPSAVEQLMTAFRGMGFGAAAPPAATPMPAMPAMDELRDVIEGAVREVMGGKPREAD
ncbi:MAG TPA: hypothetical protein VOA87_02225 [Thermoanaerobaculia bacterium]|nr:hypothetical protein [Thermoanaerobaculia bacterium]